MAAGNSVFPLFLIWGEGGAWVSPAKPTFPNRLWPEHGVALLQ